MIKGGNDVLWSADLFGSGRQAAAPLAKSLATLSVADAVAVFPVPPEQEGAYLRYGRAVLQILAASEDRAARLNHLRDVLAGRDPAFDYDALRLAITELERRQAVETVERDARGGDHLYRLTRAGWVMAA